MFSIENNEKATEQVFSGLKKEKDLRTHFFEILIRKTLLAGEGNAHCSDWLVFQIATFKCARLNCEDRYREIISPNYPARSDTEITR